VDLHFDSVNKLARSTRNLHEPPRPQNRPNIQGSSSEPCNNFSPCQMHQNLRVNSESQNAAGFLVQDLSECSRDFSSRPRPTVIPVMLSHNQHNKYLLTLNIYRNSSQLNF